MSVPHPIDPSAWKAELADFRQATDTFHAGGLAKAAYKGFSGYYGSYAQRDDAVSEARLQLSLSHI